MHSQAALKPKLHTPGGVVEFPFTGDDFHVTDEMREVFDWDGVIKVRGLLPPDEVHKLLQTFESDQFVVDRAWDLADGEGRSCKLSIWNQPGHDLSAMVARSEKVVTTCEQLIGGEVFHYHSKLMRKESQSGGKTLWHQDYGYWYKNGILRPDLLTCFIAMDKCVRENGCLQVIKGTHRCGRIEHSMNFGQTIADQERIDQISKHFEHVYAELEPGDALFFHCNVLHTSGANDSDLRRWCYLIAYNRADNDAVKDHHHGHYVPIQKVPNSAIMECTNLIDHTDKDFMDTSKDETVKVGLDHNPSQ